MWCGEIPIVFSKYEHKRTGIYYYYSGKIFGRARESYHSASFTREEDYVISFKEYRFERPMELVIRHRVPKPIPPPLEFGYVVAGEKLPSFSPGKIL